MPKKIIFHRLVEGPGPRRRQEVVQLPYSRRPASRQPARRVAAALRRRQRQLQQGLAPFRAADGHGVHGPQPLHVAVLRVEASRRVRRRSEGARVLHRLHAPVGEVLVVLNLSAPAASPRPRARRAPSCGAARCRPRPPAQSGRRSTARPCAPPSWPGPSSASGCPGPPRQWRCGPRAASCGALPWAAPGPAWRTRCPGLSARPTVLAFLFCRGSTAASRVKTSITTRPYFVFPRVFWLQPVVRPLSSRLAQCAWPGRLHLPAHVGLQRLEGHGLRHVEVALLRKSVQLPHEEVVGQVPQRSI